MERSQQPLYLVIHGHFYQPPREDPWTETIDHQHSAYPYHDWNERINKECYAANSDARVLDRHGLIHTIINNYEYVSFNFGPTLLTWLQRNDEETYGRILEADHRSRERNNGHGNAIAQVYNHMILPLANRRDKYSQVRWGLQDFRHRFGRDAEGIWLAETAVNQDSVEVLVDCGVRFIILSPTQAESVLDPDSNEWKDVSNNSIDTSQAYRIRAKNGEMAVFFYDMDIAKAVGFQHLLTSAEHFRNRILAAAPGERAGQLVNIATDGESYGHHEPFANMCLAALIEDNRAHNRFHMTNYGAYLEQFPPRAEVRLKSGRGKLGTAWSCAHGVGRWMEDCGCSDGGQPGWNQKWRAPLRHAFDYLRDELTAMSVPLGEKYVKDFWAARDDYVRILLDGSGAVIDDFFDRHGRDGLDGEGRRTVRVLMEAQKYAMFMYTSCAWFFAEVSGIETVQCMRYAARALELAREFLPEEVEEEFLNRLEQAISNIPSFVNGRRIFTDFVKRYILDGNKVVNQYLLDRIVSGEESDRRMYFYCIDLEESQETARDGASIHSGTAILRDSICWYDQRYLFYVIRKSHLEIISWVKPLHDHKVKEYLDGMVAENELPAILERMPDWFVRSYSLADLKFDYKEKLVSELFKSSFLQLHAPRSSHMDEYLELLQFYASMHIPIPEVERSGIEAVINAEIVYQLERMESAEEDTDFAKVASMLRAARATNLKVNRNMVESLFAIRIRSRFEAFMRERNANIFDSLVHLLDFSNRSGLDYERKKMENSIFQVLQHDVQPRLADGSVLQDQAILVFVTRLLRLAELLNFNVQSMRKRLEELSHPGEAKRG